MHVVVKAINQDFDNVSKKKQDVLLDIIAMNLLQSQLEKRFYD